MFDDKDKSPLHGFDSAEALDAHEPEKGVPTGESHGGTSHTQAGTPDHSYPQGYTVTPAGGYFDHTTSGGPAGASADANTPSGDAADAKQAGADPVEEKPSSEYHYSASKGDIPFAGSESGEGAASTASAAGRPGASGQSEPSGRTASAGQQGASDWQRQSGYTAGQNSYSAAGAQSGSYTPPAGSGGQTPSGYGFMPSGNYGYQNGYQNGYAYGQAQPQRTAKAPKPPKPKKEKKPSQKHFTVKAFVACALAAAVIGAGAGAGGFALVSVLQDPADTASAASTGGSDTAKTISIEGQAENLVQAVAEKVGPSVVGIRTTAASMGLFGSQSESSGEGSGIIFTDDGYIITNYHVIQAAAEQVGRSQVQVFLPSDTETGIDATIVGYNIGYDLAVLKIDKTGLPAAEIGNSNELSVGQYVVAIGNPGGLEFMGSVTYGVISGLDRKITTENSEQLNLIQTDAAINPGNSGGALVNSKGQVIGVNSVKLVSTGYESMGFAIPINQVVETCKQIISKENEPTPYLGLEISTTYDAQTLQLLGYPTGAVVQRVTAGGPAEEAGLQRGDIITEFAGTTISSYTTLNTAISQCSPGQQVTLKVYRGGRYYEANVTLGSNNVNTAD